MTLDSLLAPELPALLLFTSPHCGPCKTLVPMAAEWQREYADQLTIAFVGDGAADELRAEAEEFELANALVDTDGSLYRAFEANGTPSAVLIAPDGSIGSWVAAGSESIERLVARTLSSEPAETGLPVGAEAPALELPSLDGETVSLETLRGRETLLLFWNPDCGFCRSMHEDLLARETSANGDTPRLVVVSSGDAEQLASGGLPVARAPRRGIHRWRRVRHRRDSDGRAARSRRASRLERGRRCRRRARARRLNRRHRR